MNQNIKISEYDYNLPEERVAKFPLERRDESKLLVYRAENGTHGACELSDNKFIDAERLLPHDSLLVFNNTKVIRARLIFHKTTGARIEIFCLEPHEPADYERAFSQKSTCQWRCIVGNSKKWKGEPLEIRFDYEGVGYCLVANRIEVCDGGQVVEFEWDAPLTFGQLLEALGRIPIPPYLCRESEQIDNSRYQTVYSKFEGSVAAPTAGLHFTPEVIERLKNCGVKTAEVTLHVGAGTFLPVKSELVAEHKMHIEHFDFSIDTLQDLIANFGHIIAVGTTSVRTLESIAVLGNRVLSGGDPRTETPIGQWEGVNLPQDTDGLQMLKSLYNYMKINNIPVMKAASQIMILPGYDFKVVSGMFTNFHQPKSTLLLLVSAFTRGDWRRIYDHALENDYRFLSYGDSSLLIR